MTKQEQDKIINNLLSKQSRYITNDINSKDNAIRYGLDLAIEEIKKIEFED